jgi:hypothetical protein
MTECQGRRRLEVQAVENRTTTEDAAADGKRPGTREMRQRLIMRVAPVQEMVVWFAPLV